MEEYEQGDESDSSGSIACVTVEELIRMQEEVENDNVNAGQSESAGTETIAEDMEITTTTETTPTPTPTPTTSATPATPTIAITTNTTNTTNMVGITNTAKVESIEKQESKNIKKGYIAVVDTNYLVHNLSLFESIVLCAKIRRRRKSQGGQESTERENQLEIIIPWVVFGELDNLNKAKNRRAVSMALEEEMTSTITQRKAHAALKYLDGALMVQDNPERYAQDCSRDGKEQPEGKGANNGKYEEYDVLRGQRMDERTEEMRLREKKEIYIECDDKILDCCRYFSDKEGKSVTLLTNDKNLRIKAKVHGIKVVVGKQGEGSGYDAQNIVGRICNEIEQNEEDKADYLKEYEKLMKKNEAHRLEMPASFSDDENALTLDQRIDQLKHSFGKNKGKEKKTFGYDFGFGFGLGLGFQDNRRKRRDYEYNSRKRALDSISFSPPPQSNYPSTVKKDGSGGTYADQMWEMRGKNNNPMLKRKHWDGGRNPWHQQKKTATANGVGEQQAGDTNFVESSRNGSVNENSYSNGNINGSENDDGTAMDISTTIRERKIKNATPITAKLSAATENASTDDHTGTKMTGVSPTGTNTSVGDINSTNSTISSALLPTTSTSIPTATPATTATDTTITITMPTPTPTTTATATTTTTPASFTPTGSVPAPIKILPDSMETFTAKILSSPYHCQHCTNNILHIKHKLPQYFTTSGLLAYTILLHLAHPSHSIVIASVWQTLQSVFGSQYLTTHICSRYGEAPLTPENLIKVVLEYFSLKSPPKCPMLITDTRTFDQILRCLNEVIIPFSSANSRLWMSSTIVEFITWVESQQEDHKIQFPISMDLSSLSKLVDSVGFIIEAAYQVNNGTSIHLINLWRSLVPFSS